jgi:hypothetical protein
MHEGEDGIEVMGLVQQEEFDPVGDGKETESRVRCRPCEEGLAPIGADGEDRIPVGVDLVKQ